MSVRNWLNRLFAKKSPSAKKPTCRPFLEALENRTVPSASGQLVWTGSGSASSTANWTDELDHNHYAPTANDQLLFGDGGLGANTPCTFDANMTVDRVVMDSHYTNTITIPSGITLRRAARWSSRASALSTCTGPPSPWPGAGPEHP